MARFASRRDVGELLVCVAASPQLLNKADTFAFEMTRDAAIWRVVQPPNKLLNLIHPATQLKPALRVSEAGASDFPTWPQVAHFATNMAADQTQSGLRVADLARRSDKPTS